MERIYTELNQFSQWPSSQRTAALKQLLPRELMAEVVTESSLPSNFCCRLLNWFMLWFVVGIGLFSRDSYRQVFKWLNPFRPKGTPERSTLCMARVRLGVAPVRRLQERVTALLATRATPGAFHHQYRLMGLDGFAADLADSAANTRAFGHPGSGRATGAFPQARVLSLCELGTHVLWRSLIKPCRRGEVTMAPALLRHLTSE
ncbi:hypothetical protein GobsT_54310 [Gemmata obscuriglobus]|uniref:Transposase IS4 N-terminal domain-containing protein n=1 Tax=Gemmata obscuriglobus TaxID=114 RepID=A0A2Z3H539_9BACT